jgi:SAM-dependent methyltransferase
MKYNRQDNSLSEKIMLKIMRLEIEKALQFLFASATGSAKVLDVGCGDQPLKDSIQSAGHKYFSLDVRQNNGGNVDFICAIDGTLPDDLMQNKPFDFVICTEVLEHVLYWDIAFRNISMLLTNGAKVLFSCPFIFPLHETPLDFWRPTIFALERYAVDNGFKVIYREMVGSMNDVTSLLLAASYTLPLRGSIASKLLNRLSGVWLKAGEILYGSKVGKRNVGFYGNFYLSNIIILEK